MVGRIVGLEMLCGAQPERCESDSSQYRIYRQQWRLSNLRAVWISVNKPRRLVFLLESIERENPDKQMRQWGYVIRRIVPWINKLWLLRSLVEAYFMQPTSLVKVPTHSLCRRINSYWGWHDAMDSVENYAISIGGCLMYVNCLPMTRHASRTVINVTERKQNPKPGDYPERQKSMDRNI